MAGASPFVSLAAVWRANCLSIEHVDTSVGIEAAAATSVAAGRSVGESGALGVGDTGGVVAGGPSQPQWYRLNHCSQCRMRSGVPGGYATLW